MFLSKTLGPSKYLSFSSINFILLEMRWFQIIGLADVAKSKG